MIGAGFGRAVHIPALRAAPGCEVVALAASSRESAARAAAEAGVPRSTGDWREIAGDPGIDAVTIAVPTALQAAVALGAIGNRKHVFLEKPLAATNAEAEWIVREASAAGVVGMVDFEFPEVPAWRRAREHVRRLGSLRDVRVTWRFQTYSHKHRTQSWKLKPEAGGGTLNQFVCHVFYNVEWLAGRIAALDARILPEGGVEDVAVAASLRFASGATGSIDVSANDARGTGHEVAIVGEKGSLTLRNSSARYFQGFELEVDGRNVPVTPLTNDRVEVVSSVMARFIEAIRSRQLEAEPSLESGLRVQALLDASRRSDRERGWIDV